MGEHGNGKSLLLNYLKHTLVDEDYCTIKINISRGTTFPEFMNKLNTKSLLRTTYRQEDPEAYYSCLECYNGKQLVVLIDNVNYIEQNSELCRFLSSCVSYGYYVDELEKRKVELGNISFVCAENSTYSLLDRPFVNSYFVPVWVTCPETREILMPYILGSTAPQGTREMLEKIVDSIVSLDSFVWSLKNPEGLVQPARNSIVRLIVMELVRFCEAGESERSEEEVISLWKYLAIKKYIESGLRADRKA